MSKTLAEIVAADRRLAILQALNDDTDYALNSHVLRYSLEARGHAASSSDVHAELQWLEGRALIRVEALRGDLWVAHLLEEGQLVARGKHHDGVARPLPR